MKNFTFNGSFKDISINNNGIFINGEKIEDFENIKEKNIYVTINGNVYKSLHSQGSVTCNNVEGNIDAGGSVNCKDVYGNIDAGGSVRCGYITGNVDAGGSVHIIK